MYLQKTWESLITPGFYFTEYCWTRQASHYQLETIFCIFVKAPFLTFKSSLLIMMIMFNLLKWILQILNTYLTSNSIIIHISLTFTRKLKDVEGTSSSLLKAPLEEGEYEVRLFPASCNYYGPPTAVSKSFFVKK